MFLNVVKRKWYLWVAILAALCFFTTEGIDNGVFYSDALGYYSFLPSTFIYHNLKSYDSLPADRKISAPVVQYFKERQNESRRSSKGYLVNQYTYGVALMEAPFFFIAHLNEQFIGETPNGYSRTYEVWIKISTLFYGLLGLWLIYKILLYSCSPPVALLTVVIMAVGSNFFWFTLQQAGMAHIPIFFLFALLIYATISLYQQQRTVWFAVVGICVGLITLIRVPAILCAAIPLFYNVYNKQTFVHRMQWLAGQLKGVMVTAIMFVLPLIPQVIYYIALTGKPWFYGYKFESFMWLQPHFYAGLLGGNNGWLAYSPAMVVCVLGMFLFKRLRAWRLVLWLIVPLYIYVTYCWTCFIYINGFGSRAMIDFYPLLAIPMAAGITWVANRAFRARFAIYSALSILILYSLMLMRQQAAGNLISECSNPMFNYLTFYHHRLSYRDLILFDAGERQPGTGRFHNFTTLKTINLRDTTGAGFEKDAVDGKSFYRLRGGTEFLPFSINIPYQKYMHNNDGWIRCSGTFMQPGRGDYNYRCANLVLAVKRGDRTMHYKQVRLYNKIGINDSTYNIPSPGLWHYDVNKWGTVAYYTQLPTSLQEGDRITLYIWNTGPSDLCVKDLRLELPQ